MPTSGPGARGWFVPIVLALVGIFKLGAYFNESLFELDDLLKGIGFLLLVPLAYLYPSRASSQLTAGYKVPAPWAKWLSWLGLALIVTGFTIQWR